MQAIIAIRRLVFVSLAVVISLPAIGCGPRLDLGEGQVSTLTIYQRERREVPASNGTLTISLGDISGSRVLVTVSDQRGKPIFDRKEMREGDRRIIELNKKKYVVWLDRLVNLFTGRDYAQFSFMREDQWQQVAIQRIIARIEASEDVFIRNGRECSGKDLAVHIRQKLAFKEGMDVTFDQFAKEIASKSITTGEAYRVKTSGGKTVKLATWLGWESEKKTPTTAPAAG